ncbi:MAG TPA: hypothetical protein VGL63_04500 [Streptosporangiaceae bacterium]
MRASRIGAVVAVIVLSADCGSPVASHGGPPPATPVSVSATAPGPPRATCGTARTAANVPVTVEVEKGLVGCAEAMRIQNGYTALVRAGRVPGNGGGAPVTVSGWTCQGESTPTIVQTGEASACHQGQAEIITILKLPGSSSSP